jgi:23S rRNA pseudouridine1911/1915/1917 synthase
MTKKANRPTPDPFTLLHLQSGHAGQTLSSALKSLLPDCSWGQVNHWIEHRHVQVNGNLCADPARRVSEKDVLKLWREPLPKPATAEQLRIPYIDEHLVVVEKPPGITSVWHREERQLSGRRRQLQPTLEELLPAAIAKEIGPPRSLRPRGPASAMRGRSARPPRGSQGAHLRWPVFPVHRLDRDTSGLMLFARTRLAEQKLVAMFRAHRIQRQYWAVVLGRVSSQTIRSVFVRDRGDGLRGSLPGSTTRLPPDATGLPAAATAAEKAAILQSEGQLAITHLEFKEAIGDSSVVRCRLETGRTHQIRIHLSELGHPLCGEKTYTRLADGSTLIDATDAPRQALHSERLAFTHPLTGEQLEFRMPLPPDLKRWLARLRSQASGREGSTAGPPAEGQADSRETDDDSAGEHS